jgi:hypothetical protein
MGLGEAGVADDPVPGFLGLLFAPGAGKRRMPVYLPRAVCASADFRAAGFPPPPSPRESVFTIHFAEVARFVVFFVMVHLLSVSER